MSKSVIIVTIVVMHLKVTKALKQRAFPLSIEQVGSFRLGETLKLSPGNREDTTHTNGCTTCFGGLKVLISLLTSRVPGFEVFWEGRDGGIRNIIQAYGFIARSLGRMQNPKGVQFGLIRGYSNACHLDVAFVSAGRTGGCLDSDQTDQTRNKFKTLKNGWWT